MTRNQLALVALVAGTAACNDQLLDPASLADHPLDGRDSLFATGSEEEQRLAEQLAYDYIDANQDRVLMGIDELATHLVQISSGKAHVRIDQDLDGLPVFGAQAIVHLDENGDVMDLTDGWEHGVDVDTTADLDEADATELAVDESGGWDHVSEYPDVKLGVLRHSTGDHLAYRIRIPRLDGTDRTSIPVVFLDAHDGTVIWSYDDLQTATCTANTPYNGNVSFPCDSSGSGYKLVSSSGDAGVFTAKNQQTTSASSISDVTNGSTNWTTELSSVDAQYGILKTLEYYQNTYGRNGIDGNGGPKAKSGVTTGVVHYGRNYGNAYWDGSEMVFGDGDNQYLGPVTAMDIAGHELTHGVTEHTANLTYSNEPGALNESMSDVMGSMVERYAHGDGEHVWQVGEDAWTPSTPGDALRYMDDPAKDGESADHYSNRYTGFQDNGGVHTNSGIGNLAFYLCAQGGHHPRHASVVEVPGIGADKAAKIWYTALTEWMTANTNFAGARTATENAAKALYGANSPEVFSVSAAWAEVGVGSPPSGGNPPPPDTTPTDPGTGSTGDNLDESGLSASTGQSLSYQIDVPEGATNLVIAMSGGTGDADLYVRQGSAPTDSAFDCRPYKYGNNETCTIAAPKAGTWYVRINAYQSFSGVALTSSYDAGSSTNPPPSGTTSLDVSNLSDSKGGEQRWTVDAASGASSLTVKITGGTGDADLYVRQGSDPTTSTWDCRPYKVGNEETCTIDHPSGTYHVMVRAYATYSGVHLTAN